MKRLVAADDDGSELVLVVDQLEEVFTLVEDETRRTQFLALLERAVLDPHARLRVVVTLRADFYDRPLLYSGFAELLRDYVEALVPLKADEFERAIAGPAERVGARFEPGLLSNWPPSPMSPTSRERCRCSKVHPDRGLYERREGSTFTADAYRAIGGISGALAGRAEEIYGGPGRAGSGGCEAALPPPSHARRGCGRHAPARRAHGGVRLDGGRSRRSRRGDPGVRRVAAALVRPRPAERDADDRGRARGAHARVGPLPALDRQRPRAGAPPPTPRRSDPRVGGGRPRVELPATGQQPRPAQFELLAGDSTIALTEFERELVEASTRRRTISSWRRQRRQNQGWQAARARRRADPWSRGLSRER